MVGGGEIRSSFSPSNDRPSMIQDILVPTDFSDCADAALDHALRLAERFDATLHLVHVISELDAGLYGLVGGGHKASRLDEHIESEVQNRLTDIAADAASLNIRTEVLQQFNLDVDAAIDDYVSEHGIDLVVMGTHGRTGLRRLMIGSVANKLIRRTWCPVLTVRSQSENGEASRTEYENVLAPIDFSDHSKVALRLSKEIAARYNAHLHLLFVAERQVLPTFSDTGLPGVSVVEMDPEIVSNAEAALSELNENVGGPKVSSTYHVKEGEVAQDIIDFSETHDIDLISMATRGLTGFSRFLLGSNTERVVRVAPCPVLTVPAHRDEQEE